MFDVRFLFSRHVFIIILGRGLDRSFQKSGIAKIAYPPGRLVDLTKKALIYDSQQFKKESVNGQSYRD